MRLRICCCLCCCSVCGVIEAVVEVVVVVAAIAVAFFLILFLVIFAAVIFSVCSFWFLSKPLDWRVLAWSQGIASSLPAVPCQVQHSSAGLGAAFLVVIIQSMAFGKLMGKSSCVKFVVPNSTIAKAAQAAQDLCRSLQIWSWRSWTCQTPSCDCGERHTHSREPVKVASCTQCPKPEDAWLMHGLGMRSPGLGWWSYRFDFDSCYLVLLHWSSMIQHSIIQKGPAAIDSCDGWNLWHAMSGRISSYCRVDHCCSVFSHVHLLYDNDDSIYIYIYKWINKYKYK